MDITVARAGDLSRRDFAAVIDLCSRAFETDYRDHYVNFPNPVHVMGRLDGELVSHALWVTRWLVCGGLPPLRTAYVEAVATEERHRGRGFASAVMQAVADSVVDFELAGLATGVPEFYHRLGWETWHGPLFVRAEDGLMPTPGETVMVLRLPKTPPLDVTWPLSVEWREGELW